MTIYKYTIKTFKKEFRVEGQCLNFILQNRIVNHSYPICNNYTNFRKALGKASTLITMCDQNVYPLSGTPLSKSNTKLIDF